MSDNSDWVTVSEAARRLGVSRAAIRNRVKRGTLPSQSDNHGHPMVKVPLAPPGTVCAGRFQKVPSVTVPDGDQPQTRRERAGLVSLDDVRAMLGEVSARHSEALAAMERQHRDAMAMMTERIDAAECRAEALLERALLPWWRRWFW